MLMRVLAGLLLLTISSAAFAASCPLVIAHRGASGDRPEHTLEAYDLAIGQGADFIEPDLVPTRDGVLIARHENALAVVALDDEGSIKRINGQFEVTEATTDVADHAEFVDRLVVKTIDGKRIGGWFSEDFTFREVETLKARERLPALRPGNTTYNDRFGIPSFRDVLKLAQERGVGVYPELKHYTWFMGEATDKRGQPVRHDTLNLLLRDLGAFPSIARDQVFIQSFEVEPLLRLRAIADAGDAPAWPLVQLIGQPDLQPPDLAAKGERTTWGDLLRNPEALKKSHADVVAPAFQALLADPGLVERLRAAGLKVHTWTLRAERPFLPEGMTFESLFERLNGQSPDGIFTDHPGRLRRVSSGCRRLRD